MDAELSQPLKATLPVALTEALRRAGNALDDGKTAMQSQPERRSGETLRPGPATPLWNALVAEIAPLLEPHGAQAQLARALGIHRQTINTWFKSRTRMPDAERTLQLMAWLLAKGNEAPPG